MICVVDLRIDQNKNEWFDPGIAHQPGFQPEATWSRNILTVGL